MESHRGRIRNKKGPRLSSIARVEVNLSRPMPAPRGELPAKYKTARRYSYFRTLHAPQDIDNSNA